MLGYSAAGALVAASMTLLGRWGATVGWLRPWWSMLHLAALCLGIWLACAGRQPVWLAALGQGAALRWWPGRAATAPLGLGVPGAGALATGVVMTGPRPARPSWWRAGFIGSVWVVLPCGLLQSALLVAALASTPVSGALVMASFALSSSLGLVAGPLLWSRLNGASVRERWQSLATRAAGLMLAAASAWALAMAWHKPGVDLICL